MVRFSRQYLGSVWVVAFAAAALLGRAAAAEPPVEDVTAYVNPFIGTGGHGHTYPGATVPFGMVQLSADTFNHGWDWCSGYHWSDASIMGFSHTHTSGAGASDLGDILLMPSIGKLQLAPGTREDPDSGYRSRFSHLDEIARPGYYAVALQDTKIRVELTATRRVGFHRYVFPASDTAHVVIDLVHGIDDKPLALELDVKGNKLVTGLRRSSGWARDQLVYFAAEFSKPFASFGTATDDARLQQGSRHAAGKHVKGFVFFKTKENEAIHVKVAISAVSVENALNNLRAEIPGWDFDGVRNAAHDEWQRQLGKIQLGGASQQGLEIFYTALYHAMLAPTLFSDVDGRYRGVDRKVHTAKGFNYYSTFSLWDTFRAAHPLYTLLDPTRVADMINSMRVHAEQHEKHMLPIWPLHSYETYCMIGYHSFPVIAEAHAKGIGGFDAEALYKLMRDNARRNDWYAQYGYIPADKEKEAVSKTLEFAYDDWALAQMAKRLGKQEDYAFFLKRSEFYRNVFDKQAGFMRGKLLDGSWRAPFLPHAINKPGNPQHDFTEGSSWQYTWFVPHDVEGLIQLLGGRDKFVKKLDALFATKLELEEHVPDVSGLIGQYAHGNEPSHHIAYLYNYAGAPWRTQELVHRIKNELYTGTPEGLSGNEDCGQMSAWYIFSAIGFYPVNPAEATYILGTPSFPEATIQLPGAKTFRIKAKNLRPKAFYVRGARLNGKPLERSWLSHAEIMAGGTLELEMSTAPNKKWGRALSALPPSMSRQ